MSSPPGSLPSPESKDSSTSAPTPNPSTSAAATSIEDFAAPPAALQAPRPPSLRAVSEAPSISGSNAISNPLGAVNNARRPGPPPSSLATARAGGLPEDMQAKMKAFHLSRQGAPPLQNLRMPSNTPDPSKVNQLPSSAGALPTGISPKDFAMSGAKTPVGPSVGGFRAPMGGRPQPANYNSAPAVPGAKLSLAAKRGLNKGMKLSDASSSAAPANEQATSGASPKPDGDKATSGSSGSSADSMFAKYSEFVDTKTGTLKFKGKATIHGKGIDFSSGTSFNISLDEVDNLDELGKGNYGT
ncbi:MAG: hypothetical protein Q9180_008872, partial [Flavoplaca navasiana]